MIKKTFNRNLFEFIKDATCSFTCIEIIRNKLINNGYLELFENEKWTFKAGKYFVIIREGILHFCSKNKRTACVTALFE